MSRFEIYVTEDKFPTNDDKEAWTKFWKSNLQPWRTEPIISDERQHELAERDKIKPDIEQGIYPFKDMKLRRADIEWLLSTHDNHSGPVNWNDESQREREGLDLRGADLRGEQLYDLPLARINAGARFSILKRKGDRSEAAITHLEGADLTEAHLEGASLPEAHLEGANLHKAHLEGADLTITHLERADLSAAHLEGANLNGASLEDAILAYAHLEGANLSGAFLEGAILNAAFFDSATDLERIGLSNSEHGAVSLVDVHWGDVNVAVVDWSSISILGDENKFIEYERRNKKRRDFKRYQDAARAYRQLSIVLRDQGLNDDAARFAYRSQLMQRAIFREQRKYGQYLFSLFLDLLSGYGYKPWRCFAAYLIVILSFATTYFIIGHTVGPVLSPLGSVVFSMTSFHGRGFFPGGIELDDPLTVVAAFEAFIGLLIEVTFIATLTRRLFGQ